MPRANFGEDLSFSNNFFIRLKEKGDKIEFRILDVPLYDGKHFLKNPDGSWNVISCSRINKTGECSYCKEFFRLKALVKKTDDEKEKKDLEKQARNVGASVQFYYPVIDRSTEEFKVFQTTIGVRSQIEAEIEMGANALTTDFICLNTGEVGKGRYKVSKVDSSKSKDLTEKELTAVEKYKSMDLEEVVSGTRDDDGKVSEDVNTEVEEDINV